MRHIAYFITLGLLVFGFFTVKIAGADEYYLTFVVGLAICYMLKVVADEIASLNKKEED